MKYLILATFAFSLSLTAPARAETAPLPKHQLPVSPAGNLVVGNCDGKSSVEVPGVKEGEKLKPEQARAVATQLMAEWKKQNPGARWVAAETGADVPKPSAKSQKRNAKPDQGPNQAKPLQGTAQPSGNQPGPDLKTVPKADPVTAAGATQQKAVTHQEGTYTTFNPQDQKMWELEQNRLIEQGNQIFHSADRLGSRTGVSCDMCHPNAANTHPETYPKYQVQLQRVAMLRDMINWCIENPSKGPMLKEDSFEMRALEAYIISQRKGVALAPGKH